MDDLISRQAAIEALKNDMASLDHIIKGMSAYDVRLDAYVSQRNQVNYDIYTINNLPPALGTNLAEVGTDCISRQQAIDIAKDLTITVEGYEMHNQAVMNYCADIMQLPPIQPAEPQIIRCKDCKYAEYIDDVKTLWCTECGQGRTVAPYDFCSYAERREVKT